MVVVHVLCSSFCSWAADWMCFLHDCLSFQNHMAQRHHLSKALVVSLMKNHHFKKVFAKGKGRTLWYGDFFNFWYEFNKWVYTKSSWVTFRFWSSSQVSAQNLHFKLHKALRLPGNLHFIYVYIYIDTINCNEYVYIFMCGWSWCMFYVLCSAAE